jgi:hypothetical protein
MGSGFFDLEYRRLANPGDQTCLPSYSALFAQVFGCICSDIRAVFVQVFKFI